jgi:hypothetical protein
MNLAIEIVPGIPGRTTAHGHGRLVRRLSEASVRKQYDPYLDIDWDAPEHAIDPRDPRHCIAPDHPLAQTAWYDALDADSRARFGLEWTAQVLKYGIHFESVLGRGLLEFCENAPNRSPEYRYAMHEVVEEGRHSLMFQEYVNRTGTDPHGVGYLYARINGLAPSFGRTFPEFFFFCVLSGEVFIDDENRALLRRNPDGVHPLLRQIMQIHVTEEARHLCFAEHYLRQRLPALSRWKRMTISLLLPWIFADAAKMMLIPDARLQARFGISSEAMRQAFGPDSAHRGRVAKILAPIHSLCRDHGMLNQGHARLWHAFGLPA